METARISGFLTADGTTPRSSKSGEIEVDEPPLRFRSAEELEAVLDARAQSSEFRERDAKYQAFRRAFVTIDSRGARRGSDIGGRRVMMWDDNNAAMNTSRSPAMPIINMVKQAVRHHKAKVASIPVIRNAVWHSDQTPASRANERLLQSFFGNNGNKAVHLAAMNDLSLYGDCVLGLEWDESSERKLWQRAINPWYCYPTLDPTRPGVMYDLLVAMIVDKFWAISTYGEMARGGPEEVERVFGSYTEGRLFIYWDDTHKYTALIGGRSGAAAPKGILFCQRHGIGFVPFVWVFNDSAGMFAQSDIADIPPLQDKINDLFKIYFDAARKNIDKAYWGRMLGRETVLPRAGEVISFNDPNAAIFEFPNAVPPDSIMGMLQQLQGISNQSAGISPVSAEGTVQGSIITGTAIRRQIEAIESRVATKMVSLENAYGEIAGMALRIMDAVGIEVAKTDRIDWWHCEAKYRETAGLPIPQRQELALQVLGRLAGIETAAEIAWPDRDPEVVMDEIERYQVNLATISAKAQLEAQKMAAEYQPQQQSGAAIPPPGGPAGPQVPGAPTPPGLAGFGKPVTIGQLKDGLTMVRSLHGQVWAVGEIAITGLSLAPEVKVENKKDVPFVTSALQAMKAVVTEGKPVDGEPSIQIAS